LPGTVSFSVALSGIVQWWGGLHPLIKVVLVNYVNCGYTCSGMGNCRTAVVTVNVAHLNHSPLAIVIVD
jgi:hypothetical protein